MRTRTTSRMLALALGGALVLSGCSGDDTTADPSPTSTAEPAGDSTPNPDTDASPTGQPTDGPNQRVEAVPEGQELLLRTADGEVEVVATLDPEGESSFVSAATRPGSTARNATIVAMTRAEGMYDLRWLEIVDGEPGELTLFEEPYRPAGDLAPVDDVDPAVAWSPNGGFIAWTEWDGGGRTTLRTIGWDDGPGTGDDATDNAAFGIQPVPAGSRIQTWTAVDKSSSRITLAGPEGDTWTVAVRQQPDGALALPPDAVQEG